MIVVDTGELSRAIDGLFDMVVDRLREENVGATNFDAIWANLRIERADPVRAEWRRIEALLGQDVDQGNKRRIQGLIDDGKQLGRDAVAEIAADHASHRASMTGRRLAEIARSAGIQANVTNARKLRELTAAHSEDDVPSYSRGSYRRAGAIGLRDPGRPFAAAPLEEADGTIPAAWQQGVDLATSVRQRLGIAIDVLDDQKLFEIAGLPQSASNDMPKQNDLAFALDDEAGSSRVVLRSRSPRGRRWEVARLLGDRLAAPHNDRLFPVTRTSTYRQKRQRAFAAELLCPVDALLEVTGSAPMTDDIEDAALHFQVPAHVVVTQLHRLDRLSAGRFPAEPDVN